MSKDITKGEVHITEPPRSLDLYSKRSPNLPFESKSLSSSTSTSFSNTSLNHCQPEPTKLTTPPSNQGLDASNKPTTTKLTSWWQDWWNKKPTETSNEPKLLDKYTMIKRKLGKGSTCLIQLVSKEEEPGIEVKYVVKVFYKDFLSDNKNLDLRVGQEFCLNSGLNHRNIVKVHDLLKNDQDNWCQVIEYCPAGDLRHIVQDGFLNEPEINCCFKQIMEGLSYIHSMGIAHRDIKPENILINQDCVVKIADFGCAKAFYDTWNSPCDATTGLVGSEPYIAPELLKSYFYAASKKNDARSIDIWACGILYLAMFMGRLPFTLADENRDKVYAQYLGTRDTPSGFPPFQTLKRGPRSLLLAILHPDPTQRASMKSIQADPWYQEIELCTKGHAQSSFHVHYSLD